MDKLKCKTLYRSATFDRASVSEDDRTVELAFSSEEPVQRWFGTEILDHAKKSVKLGRLRSGGPILVDHDPRDHVGVVVSVSIDEDRRGRAKVRFGRSSRAVEIFNDVIDGIRTNISVGYSIEKAVEESEGIFRATSWTPHEISFVSIPADVTVGVGRAEDEEFEIEVERIVVPEPESQPEPEIIAREETKMTVDVHEIADKARKEELGRVRSITAIGKRFERESIATKAIEENWSVDQAREAILDDMGTAAPIRKVTETPDIGLTNAEAKQFSFVRAMNALANPRDQRARERAAFEFDCSEAAQKRTGKTSSGILIPADILVRDLTVGTATAGGHLVATELLGGSFIDLLRKRMIISALGGTVLDGLMGDIAIPRQTGGATGYWVAESGAPTESQQSYDQVALAPKTVGAFTDYSRKLLLQSSIGVENFIRGDITKVIGLEIDRAALYGLGSSNQPLGLANQTGLNTTNFAAALPTFAEVVGLESEVAADNADIGTMAYACNAAMRGHFKTTEKFSSTGMTIWEAGNTVNGYRCEVSNQIGTGDVIFGNWADLLIGFWSGLDIVVDPYAGATSGTVRIVALQDCDVAVRHPESFCRGNDNP